MKIANDVRYQICIDPLNARHVARNAYREACMKLETLARDKAPAEEIDAALAEVEALDELITEAEQAYYSAQ